MMHPLIGTPVLAGLIVVALLFDFLNGPHDSANSIATVVATRILRPFIAVLWAALFNFIAFAVFGLHVAAAISGGAVKELAKVWRTSRFDTVAQRLAIQRDTALSRRGSGMSASMACNGENTATAPSDPSTAADVRDRPA